MRDDQRAGVIAATLANLQRDPKKRATPWTWEDFLRPQQAQRQTQPRQSWQEMLAIAEMYVAVRGDKDDRATTA